ncbi:MAG: PH domain-containing protein [Candidatus Bathyarchaeota archaeon]|nr:PH domain-containing protein [Candidatus Bathyarchaeota archaeon]MCZ2844975.1 PH domain-containing protein [Candidatus Bathyarchaeota archaeon]
MKNPIRVNEIFKPHSNFKKLYNTYLVIGLIVFYLSWAIPVNLLIYMDSGQMTAFVVSLFLFSPIIVIVIFTAFWIPKFHSSLSYLLTESDIIVEKGVWWKRKSIVPYNRVTNVEVIQGPLSRRLELGKVSIQTAGFSAGGSSGSAKVAEAVILGTKNFEEVKDFVMARVKRFRPMAIEAEAEVAAMGDVNVKILDELKKIRKSLEKMKD